MSAYTIAVLGLAAALVSAAVAVLAFVRSGRHASRIERLEAETLAHATGYRLTVAPSDPELWTLDGDYKRVEELVAHVTNAGLVDSPPVKVNAFVGVGEAVGESDAHQSAENEPSTSPCGSLLHDGSGAVR